MLLLSTAAGATPICRWVDERGQTQLAAVVPHAYKKNAVCSDSLVFELTAAQAEAAALRRADDQARARRAAAGTSGAGAASAASRPAAKRPRELITDATDCPSRWRLYDESVGCFAPYRTIRGAVKQEGFKECNVVASPELRCGPRRP